MATSPAPGLVAPGPGAPAATPPGGARSASTGRRRLGYRPAFDGVRGVAWIVVFAAHAGLLRPYAAGQVAMFVFFALSGFLITELLVEERQATGAVSLRRFFARRALRLLPALYLFLACWLAVVLATWGHAPWTGTVPGGGGGPGTQPLAGVEGVAAALGYATNWVEIFHGFSTYVSIGHLWSLAVEEQFYLCWAPLAVLLLARGGRRLVGWAAAALAVGSFLEVAVVHGGGGIPLAVDMGTGTRAGAFLIGAALAVWWSRGGPAVDALSGWLHRPALALVVGVLTFASWSLDHRRSPELFATTWVAVSVASGLLVLCLLDNRSQAGQGLLASKVLTYLGRRSYALYLWHYVWLTWLHGLGTAGILVALVASLASGEISWQLVERPALARKARFTPPRAAPGRPVPAGLGPGLVQRAKEEPDDLLRQPAR